MTTELCICTVHRQATCTSANIS